MDLISREAAINALCQAGCGSGHCGVSCDDVKAIEQIPSAHPDGKIMLDKEAICNKGESTMMDLIERQAAIDAVESAKTARTPDGEIYVAKLNAEMNIRILPSAQPENDTGLYVEGFNDGYKQARMDARHESLTDKEQRIFLAAMGREEKVCKEVDRNYVREPYEDSLVRVCKEIRRKVKGALWT